ncbi:MAG: hypothetical protein M1826_006351 [Phylliscum demangeonii]|nr:MAG: hypothetical protein M1826_006351 [Phylliscum demangeonii]
MLRPSLGGGLPRMLALGAGFFLFLIWAIRFVLPAQHILDVPRITLDFHPARYNESKVALLIENRAIASIAPLTLHMISVVPPDWRFRFMGSAESIALMNASVAIQRQVQIGKLDLTEIPSNMSTAGQEMISRFLTTLWLYETVLQPAEWLLIYQTDSILCANSQRSLNDWLDYDWVGAPWSPSSRWGGNGGLSLRRVSAIVDVLRNQNRRPDSEPEDVWLTSRLGHRPNAKTANGTVSLIFSGENWYREKPMGYHTGGTGRFLGAGIWGTPDKRREIWEYCPEIKMTLEMDAKVFVPGDCNTNWKRDVGVEGEGEVEGGVEGDGEGEQWPIGGLVPW